MNFRSFILVCVAFLVSMARPQTSLKWNFESVILSRNGPSTTTTPRPTRWSTTTLRQIEEASIKSVGSVGTVEDAFLVPRVGGHRGRLQASSSSVSGLNHLLLIVGLVLSSVGLCHHWGGTKKDVTSITKFQKWPFSKKKFQKNYAVIWFYERAAINKPKFCNKTEYSILFMGFISFLLFFFNFKKRFLQ